MSDRFVGDYKPLSLPPYAESAESVACELDSSFLGLDPYQVDARLHRDGPNSLPEADSPTIARLFISQFKSPLIYVLMVAGIISLVINAFSDAAFIFAVLLINAGIGLFQEWRAERSAHALKGLVANRAQVLRSGEAILVDAQTLVAGDVVMLESGAKVPADMRLLDSHDLSVNESVLTGESLAVHKQAGLELPVDTPMAERSNMLFAGGLVDTGRARGMVTATGARTELGQIASAVLGKQGTKVPLLVRMDKFTQRVTIATAVASVLLVMVSLSQGASLSTTLLLAVALAVSAIPEGLPVALTVALSVGMQRMAACGAIVRRLVAVEALGSCTYIASDKTGTLTVNQLTVRQIELPGEQAWTVTGEGMSMGGAVLLPEMTHQALLRHRIELLARTMVFPNEGALFRTEGDKDLVWTGHGDSVDVALLVFAHKAGFTKEHYLTDEPQVASISYESERQFAASLHRIDGELVVFVKGALERLLPMCSKMSGATGEIDLACGEVIAQANGLAESGLRVLAGAYGKLSLPTQEQSASGLPAFELSDNDLKDLCLAGLVAMSDPPRAGVSSAIQKCRTAGIAVAMVTGDDPRTAFAVAREIDLTHDWRDVVTGAQLREASQNGQIQVENLCRSARVFARVEPQQKLQIVTTLQGLGHFVAVTGDGANDAPALRAAQVGVAMGLHGTDITREVSDIVLTDDNFSSIVAGVEQGRVVYGNVRKVIFLLISTGAAEVVLFALTLLAGLPLPLMAVQLLWLNLVTNGLQDVALAFEPAEGDELRRAPRASNEGVFDRRMLQQVFISACTMGGVAFLAYDWLISAGWAVDAARNMILLLMVMFENLHALNSRSETRSILRLNPLRNKFLLLSVLAAQAVHLGAMYTPGLNDVLDLTPVSLSEWFVTLLLASSLVLVNEIYKWLRRKL